MNRPGETSPAGYKLSTSAIGQATGSDHRGIRYRCQSRGRVASRPLVLLVQMHVSASVRRIGLCDAILATAERNEPSEAFAGRWGSATGRPFRANRGSREVDVTALMIVTEGEQGSRDCSQGSRCDHRTLLDHASSSHGEVVTAPHQEHASRLVWRRRRVRDRAAVRAAWSEVLATVPDQQRGRYRRRRLLPSRRGSQRLAEDGLHPDASEHRGGWRLAPRCTNPGVPARGRRVTASGAWCGHALRTPPPPPVQPTG